jgi:hypothetical protein
MGEKHVYEADKALFRFMRQRLQKQALRRHGMRMVLGRNGQVTLWPAVDMRRYLPHFEIRLEAYSTGRVYMALGYQQETTADTFADVIPVAVSMVRTLRQQPPVPQPVWEYGKWMFERTIPRPLTDMVPVQQAKRLRRQAKHAAWYAKQAALPPPPPVPLPEPLPPMSPAEIAMRQKLAGKMLVDLMYDMDAKIIASFAILNAHDTRAY